MSRARKSASPKRTPNASSRGAVLAADIGGTNLRCGLVSASGKVLHWSEQSSRPGATPAGMVKVLAQACRELLETAGHRGRVPPVGIGVAGGVDTARGVVTQCPQFSAWKNFDLGPRLSRELGTKVRVANDVDCALLGEVWKGALRGEKNAMAYWLGTGVGGALYLNGKLWNGPSGMAGEVGHSLAEPGGAKCNCGALGCLETFASATGISRLARPLANAARPLKGLPRGKSPTAQDVYDAAAAGDTRAREIWKVVGRALGESVGGMVNVLSVDRIVIGGKVSRAHRFFMPELRRAAKARAFHYPYSRLQIRIAALGDEGALLGAAALARGIG